MFTETFTFPFTKVLLRKHLFCFYGSEISTRFSRRNFVPIRLNFSCDKSSPILLKMFFICSPDVCLGEYNVKKVLFYALSWHFCCFVVFKQFYCIFCRYTHFNPLMLSNIFLFAFTAQCKQSNKKIRKCLHKSAQMFILLLNFVLFIAELCLRLVKSVYSWFHWIKKLEIWRKIFFCLISVLVEKFIIFKINFHF